MSTMVIEDADLARIVHATFRNNGPYPLDEVLNHLTLLSAANATAYNKAYAHHQDVQEDPARGCTKGELLQAYKRIQHKKIRVAGFLQALALLEYNLDDEINVPNVAYSFSLIRATALYHLAQAMEKKKVVY